MDWLEEAKEKTNKQVKKICQLIEDRYFYDEKIDELCNLSKELKNEKLTKLLQLANYYLSEWKNGPTLGLNSPTAIISTAEEYKKRLDELIAKIHQKIFPC